MTSYFIRREGEAVRSIHPSVIKEMKGNESYETQDRVEMKLEFGDGVGNKVEETENWKLVFFHNLTLKYCISTSNRKPEAD